MQFLFEMENCAGVRSRGKREIAFSLFFFPNIIKLSCKVAVEYHKP